MKSADETPPQQPAAEAAAEEAELTAELAEQWRQLLEPLTGNPWALSLAALLASFVLAKLGHLFLSVGVRAITRRTASKLDDRIVQRLQTPLVQSVVLLGLALCGRLLLASERQADFVERGLLTLFALVWIGFAFRIAGLLLHAVSRDNTRFTVLSGPAFPLFENAVKVVIFFAAAWVLIEVWGLDPTGWLASAGIMGIALGFAAQDTLANLFAGVSILADRPFKVGDYIVLDSGERGRAVNIGLRSTRLLTRDDTEVTIPNRVIGQAKIVNESGGGNEKMRVRAPVGVAYGSDIAQVRAALLVAAADCPLVETEPAPRARFRSFGDSSLNFELLFWVDQPERRGAALDDLLERIALAFAREGIAIPFPQRDVWLRTAPPHAGGDGTDDGNEDGLATERHS